MQRGNDDYSAQVGLEPRGGNMYKGHMLQCNSGEFWRCKHGNTGTGKKMNWTGCFWCALNNPKQYIIWKLGIEKGRAEKIYENYCREMEKKYKTGNR